MPLTRLNSNSIASGGISGASFAAGSIGASKLDAGFRMGPKISSVAITDSSWTVLDDTAVDTAGGYIQITGSDFDPGCQIYLDRALLASVTFVSATTLRAVAPAKAAGSYLLQVVNTDGKVATRVNAITYSPIPVWSTGSTLPQGTVNVAYSQTLAATGATTYALVDGEILPPGLSLSSGGVLSGTVTGIAETTVYSFAIRATDAQLQDAIRTFSLTVVV